MFSSTKEQISTNRTPFTSDSPQTLKSKSFPQVQPHAGLQSSIFIEPKSSAICSSDEREKDEKVECHSAALGRHRNNYGPFLTSDGGRTGSSLSLAHPGITFSHSKQSNFNLSYCISSHIHAQGLRFGFR